MTLVILACALPSYNNWWPLFVLTFYVISPIPLMIASRLNSADSFSGGASSAVKETCLFLTTGIVISAYGLPLVLLHAGIIEAGATALIVAGNTWCFMTILAFFLIFNREDEFEFQMW